VDNNIDPIEVSNKLQNLIEIKKILIARVFPMMLIYKLYEGQHRYYGNIINFPQDIQKFALSLPKYLSVLNMLIIYYQSASNLETFRDFKVYHVKVTHALIWLK